MNLTLEEKAALCLGSTFWHTAPIDRLGIPAIMVSDGPHGLRRQPDGNQAGITGALPATCFPTASALGSSWDPDLVRRIGAAIGAEARALSVAVVLGPGVNIKRSPLCGRNFEYFSEDPLLTGVLGEAHVTGVQSQGVGACVKHFAANNQETDRLRVSADVDERTLREIYLPHFERIVTRAKPWMVMSAYNLVNGVPAAEHRWLLTDVLRDEWAYDGVVVSDWGAVRDRVAALVAGLDLEMPPKLGISDAAIVAAVRDGRLDEKVLDQTVERILRLIDRAPDPDGPFDVDAHHALARAAAADCAVLLKNDRDLLPLRPAPGDTIAVIGASPRFQGAGSSQVNPTRVDDLITELRARTTVEFAAGGDQAIDLAARAATVVVLMGLPAGDETEGADRRHMDLPAEQITLLARIAQVNDNVVVVLANGSAVEVASWQQHAGAILETWLSGQAVGGAIADLLLGTVNPSGRLAETLPVRLADNPSYLNFPGEAGHVRYGEGVFVGYRAYDAVDRAVAYPFGHGLSYTTFAYHDLAVTVAGDSSVLVTCTVVNTGARHGKEVVQLYVGPPASPVARPVRELKAFAKLDLPPGAGETVTFQLDPRDLAYWSTRHQRWLVQGGAYEIAVGASSRDLRLTTTAEVPGDMVTEPLTAVSTLREWLADPAGAAALRAAVGESQGIFADPESQIVLGDFPLTALTAFPGLGLSDPVLAHAVRLSKEV
ncbi:beta-glucosidase [Actinoplanes subglobosus]|uniref:Glycoside hydrolase family 3 C-terminal domain-containing protein n=1 Tax=Actinoplanes subglobosus TaxID=1547892 RepID=A0ABV8IHQ5_9ACTN